MQTPAIPPDEAQRLERLHALELLDTPAEERFDRLTRLARYIFKVPIALVSLVDANRQWFKSRQGLEVCETERSISFCGHAILTDEILVISDATRDARFADNPLVTGEPHIRFYAGVPIGDGEGCRIGTLCIIDREARAFGDPERRALRDLADSVMHEIGQGAETHRLRRQHSADAIQIERLSQVARQTINGVVISDVEGRVEWVNQGFTRNTGYTLDEIKGRKPGELLQGPETDPEAVAKIRAALAQAQGFEIDLLNYTKAGRAYWNRINCSPLHDDQGVLTGYMAIETDVSELKRVERLQNQFISTISHELRTPLSSISGALGLLAGGALVEARPDQAQQMVDIAYRNSQRLTALINDLLDMEKLLAGKMDIVLRAQALQPLLVQAIQMNRALGDRFGVELRLLSTGTEMVKVDAQRLQQVLAHVLSNAVKFSPRGAVVELSAYPVGVSVRIQVQDRGCGIPESFRERVFEKFTQADGSDVRKVDGSGLGMAISREIVLRMDGRIGFDSVEGEGTSFWIDLPLQLDASMSKT